MTSFAFILGVVPLVLATGAGAEMRQTLGTAVFCGMLGVTFFGIFLTPVFYFVLQQPVRMVVAATARGNERRGRVLRRIRSPQISPIDADISARGRRRRTTNRTNDTNSKRMISVHLIRVIRVIRGSTYSAEICEICGPSSSWTLPRYADGW